MIPYTSFLFNPNASFDQDFDERCLRVLHCILDNTGAKIVFNTTHNRHLYPSKTIPGLLNQFGKAGFSEYIHERHRTIYPDKSRLTAINEWISLSENEIVWVALDDAELSDDRACFVDADLGIGIREYNHCLVHLNNQKPRIFL